VAPATCKDCHGEIVWAAIDGHSVPFEKTVAGTGHYEVYKMHGTYRARSHPGIGHPYVPAFRRHDCRRRQR
jgi:hypothetical protein